MSFAEVIQYLLLDDETNFILPQRFPEDCLERYFSWHRNLEHKSNNPRLFEFGYNTNTIRMQELTHVATGNTNGVYREKRKLSWDAVDNTALVERQQREQSSQRQYFGHCCILEDLTDLPKMFFLAFLEGKDHQIQNNQKHWIRNFIENSILKSFVFVEIDF